VWGVLVCLTAAWLISMANVCNRKLKDVHFSVIGFYHPLFGSCFYALYTVLFGELWVMRDTWMYGMVLVAGLVDLF
jgi:hypothetical protein